MPSTLNTFTVDYRAHSVRTGKLADRSKRVQARDADEARAKLRQQLQRSRTQRLHAISRVQLYVDPCMVQP